MRQKSSALPCRTLLHMATSSKEVAELENKKECLDYPIQRLLLLGAPGSGKGTLSVWFKNEKNLVQLSTGEMLREAVANKSDLGTQVEQIMARGDLVSDDIVCAIVEAKIKTMIAENTIGGGILFDGFPRTHGQAVKLEEALDRLNIPLTGVFHLECSDEVLKKRICGRWIHPGSGRVYHAEFHPPKTPFKDDVTGEDLIQRPDDSEEVFQNRIKTYNAATKTLTSFYSERGILYEVDAGKSVQEVRNQIGQYFNEAHAACN